MLTGSGVSPLRMTVLALGQRPGTGRMFVNALVYGARDGRRPARSRRSDVRPRYMTAMRSLMTEGGREVVGEENVGDAELLLLLDHQLEDVVADGDVEGGDRLVDDDDVRLSTVHRRSQTRSLPARELCG